MALAIKEQDAHWQREVQLVQKEHAARIESNDKAADDLRVRWQEAWVNISKDIWYHTHCQHVKFTVM